MIDGERRGPFELDRLSAEGVRPDTYVWCKGMADWDKAENVADICRYYRRRIFDLQHGGIPAVGTHEGAEAAEQADEDTGGDAEDPYESVPLRYRAMVKKSGQVPGPVNEQPVDTSRPPSPLIFISLLMTLFCFPITGLVAVWYSYKARSAWQESQRSESPGSRPLYDDSERENLRRQAHDYDRQAKMWIGITFFLSFILYAFLGHKLL